MKPQINFNHLENFDLSLGSEIKYWIVDFIQQKGFYYTEINFNFYKDKDLLEINKNHLNHDFYTDIITFDNTINKTISADIAISLDRVKDNAKHNNTDFLIELKRVMIHGILHCMGHKDNNDTQKQIMRKEENNALELFHVEHNNYQKNV